MSTGAQRDDDTLAAIRTELDRLCQILAQLRNTAGSTTFSLSDLAGDAQAARGLAANISKTPAALRLITSAETGITATRAALRQVEVRIGQLERQIERAQEQSSLLRAQRAETTARLKERERLLELIQVSPVWKAVKPFWKLLHRAATRTQKAPALSSDLTFSIDAPSDWQIRGGILVIRGWCFSRTGRDIAGVRAKIGRKGRLGRYGLPRPDLAATSLHGASQSGFTIEMPLPSGKSTVQLEAITQGGTWEPFFRHEVERVGGLEAQEAQSDQFASDGSTALPRLGNINAAKMVALVTTKLREHGVRSSTARPVISVLTPIFNTKPQWLAEAALSLAHQTFADWEWCLVDDGSTERETVRFLEQLEGLSPRVRLTLGRPKAGIGAATNAALDAARGEFVCFLDHDDLLAPEALGRMLEKLATGFDAAYSDEDKLDDATGERNEPFFKPAWSPEYLRGAMYVGHLLCVRRELASKVRFNSEFDGVQDFEFMLRLSETGAKIAHVPRILYHWRKTPGSIAQHGEAKDGIAELQQRAVNAHLARVALPAKAEPLPHPHRLRIVPAIRSSWPRVSIIIPTKDAPDLLARCLGSLFDKTNYPDFEVILADNETTDPEAQRLMQQHPVRRFQTSDPFNFSRANNQGAELATGSLLLFLNNDTEIATPDWLQHLAFYAEQIDVGAAGALLVYPNRAVQHAGVALGIRGTADHLMRGFPHDADGYAGSLACAREVSAVTAACMMMRKPLFEEIGGFNEHFFTAYQDLDLCLRLRARGQRIIYTPQALVVHHEWASRKTYYDMIDRTLLLDQWEEVIDRGDPYYNRNLHLERGDYSPAVAP